MAYLGIGYSGSEQTFLRDQVNKYIEWLKGDRLPRFFGDSFLVLYDSNTAREFAKKCLQSAPVGTLVIYPMERPLKQEKPDK